MPGSNPYMNIFELSVLGHFSVTVLLFLFFLVKLLHISSSQNNWDDVLSYQVYIYEYYITVSIKNLEVFLNLDL